MSASSWLHGLADRDCDCDRGLDDRLSNPCEVCQARHARQLIEDILAPKHEVLWPERMKNLAERIFVDLWRKQQERSPGLNGGYGTLELILQPEAERAKAARSMFGGLSQGHVPHVSQRDATVAATVIQWLGTSCGGSFIRDAENRIKQEQAVRQEFSAHYPLSCSEEAYKAIMQNDALKQVATSVAADYVSTDKHPDAVRCLANAIVNVAVQWHKRELAKLLTGTKPDDGKAVAK